ncbi:MAG: FAD-dependent oxidoreductase [Planctomycetota bacterium]
MLHIKALAKLSFPITLLVSITMLGTPGAGQTSLAEEEADVLVYGSSPGGFCAAIAAAREGARVILVEPTDHIGGLSTGGLSHCDSNQMDRSTLRGLFDEWHRRIVEDYTDRGLAAPYDPTQKDTARWTFEPHVAMRVTRDMLDEAGVRVVTEHWLTGVEKSGATLVRLMARAGAFKAKVFVDATYEGDLMAAAGVDWTIGREGRDAYGEALAGERFPKPKMNIEGLDDEGHPLPLVTSVAVSEDTDHSGDPRVMTYSFRLCLTTVPTNRVPMPEPEHYDPARFEIVRRYLAAGGNPDQVGFDTYALPGDKWDGNNSIGRQFSIGLIGGGNDWHSADEASRQRIWETHKQYTLEFYRFLTTDPAVPEAIRSRYASLGLCKDEFASDDHWSPALYVRESRRMRGMYVLSQRDILDEPVKDDPIAIASFPIDSHDVQRIAYRDGGVINEGTIFPVRVPGKRTGYAYHVPYRSVLPKPEQCDNLLVPVALSCTHVGISSLRIEGAWMVIGQSAGVAAALAASESVTVQGVDYSKLRRRLIAQGAALELPPQSSHVIRPVTLDGIVLDDTDAQLQGAWKTSTRFQPYVLNGYVYAEQGANSTATFAFRAPRAGSYELRMAYSPHPTRASKVPVTVTCGETVRQFEVDQRIAQPEGGPFRAIGRIQLSVDADTTVTIDSGGADGFVILDAIQFVPIGK